MEVVNTAKDRSMRDTACRSSTEDMHEHARERSMVGEEEEEEEVEAGRT